MEPHTKLMCTLSSKARPKLQLLQHSFTFLYSPQLNNKVTGEPIPEPSQLDPTCTRRQQQQPCTPADLCTTRWPPRRTTSSQPRAASCKTSRVASYVTAPTTRKVARHRPAQERPMRPEATLQQQQQRPQLAGLEKQAPR